MGKLSCAVIGMSKLECVKKSGGEEGGGGGGERS